MCLTSRWPQPFKGATALERAHKWVDTGENLHGRPGLWRQRCRVSRGDGGTKRWAADTFTRGRMVRSVWSGWKHATVVCVCVCKHQRGVICSSSSQDAVRNCLFCRWDFTFNSPRVCYIVFCLSGKGKKRSLYSYMSQIRCKRFAIYFPALFPTFLSHSATREDAHVSVAVLFSRHPPAASKSPPSPSFPAHLASSNQNIPPLTLSTATARVTGQDVRWCVKLSTTSSSRLFCFFLIYYLLLWNKGHFL